MRRSLAAFGVAAVVIAVSFAPGVLCAAIVKFVPAAFHSAPSHPTHVPLAHDATPRENVRLAHH